MSFTYTDNKGRTKRAENEFYIHQHPGGDDVSDVPPPMRDSLGLSRARAVAREADNGDWIIVADGAVEIRDAAQHPVRIQGSTGTDGLGIDSEILGARLVLLNYNYTADQNLVVESTGPGEWLTRVDGEVVEHGEMHPSYIKWSAGGLGGGGWF